MNLNVKGLEPRMNINTKKQVIENTLSGYFSEHTLIRVMEYWRLHYSQKPVYVLQSFLNEVAIKENVVIDKKQVIKQILTKLHELENTSQNRLKVDGLTESVYKEQSKGFEKNSLTAFYCLYKNLQNNISNDHEKDIELDFFSQSAKVLKTNTANIKAFLNQQASVPIIHQEDDLKQLVSIYYQCLCDWLGPIQADEMLHLALEKTKNAGEYSVETLF